MGLARRRIGILGIGELAGFILRGCEGAGYPFVLSPRNHQLSTQFAARFGAEIATDNQNVVDRCDLIVVCLPAGTGLDVLTGLRFRPGQTVLSAMAGVAPAALQAIVAPAQAHCTMMPGYANALGIGPSLLFPASPICHSFLSRLGPVHVFAEAGVFEAACVFGGFSGASFGFMIAIIDWFIRHGVDPKTARQLVAETLAGNAEVLQRVDAPLAEIAAGVATPGGITQLCLEVLKTGNGLGQWDTALDAVLVRLKTSGPECSKASGGGRKGL